MLTLRVFSLASFFALISAARYFGGYYPNSKYSNRRYNYGRYGYRPNYERFQRPAYRPPTLTPGNYDGYIIREPLAADSYPTAPHNHVDRRRPYILGRAGVRQRQRPYPRRNYEVLYSDRPYSRQGSPTEDSENEQYIPPAPTQQRRQQYRPGPVRAPANYAPRPQYQRRPPPRPLPAQRPAVVSNAQAEAARPINAQYEPVDVTQPIQEGYDKIKNLQDNLAESLGDLNFGPNKIQVDTNNIPVPTPDFTSNGENAQDADQVRSYGYASKGYGYQRRNDKKEKAAKSYGYDNTGFGYLNDPASQENYGAEKNYGYSNRGTGHAKQEQVTNHRSYSYESKGVGAAKRTELLQEGENVLGVDTKAQSKYGYENKGLGTHENDGEKEKKSYGYSNKGYGHDIRQSEGAVYTPDEPIQPYSPASQPSSGPSSVPSYARPPVTEYNGPISEGPRPSDPQRRRMMF